VGGLNHESTTNLPLRTCHLWDRLYRDNLSVSSSVHVLLASPIRVIHPRPNFHLCLRFLGLNRVDRLFPTQGRPLRRCWGITGRAWGVAGRTWGVAGRTWGVAGRGDGVKGLLVFIGDLLRIWICFLIRWNGVF
jgi:hypothetical protein